MMTTPRTQWNPRDTLPQRVVVVEIMISVPSVRIPGRKAMRSPLEQGIGTRTGANPVGIAPDESDWNYSKGLEIGALSGSAPPPQNNKPGSNRDRDRIAQWPTRPPFS